MFIWPVKDCHIYQNIWITTHFFKNSFIFLMWVKNENKQREACRCQESRHARQRCTGRAMTQSSDQPGTGWPILTLVIVVEHSFLFFPSSSGRVDHSCYNGVTMELQCVTREESSLNDLQQSNALSWIVAPSLSIALGFILTRRSKQSF